MNRAISFGLSFTLLAILVPAPSAVAQDDSGQPSLYGEKSAKPRVFVTDSNSWSISGGFAGSSGGFGGGIKGGARPQTAEVIKTFGKKCRGVVVSINRQAADFVVLFDHEGGKGVAQKDNKIAVFNRAGDAIFSNSTRSLGNAVEDACKAIMNSPVVATRPAPAAEPAASPATAAAQPASRPAVPASSVPVAAPAQPEAAVPSATVAADDLDLCSVFIKSSPNGGDITIDGKFVGNTPSGFKLPPGDHNIGVALKGYKPWERTMTVMAGGSVTLDANLDKEP
jgi:pyruvate/2-oxoglutarate dehydrogenase complex dihydrolipoamide acyltransferase (E2) component